MLDALAKGFSVNEIIWDTSGPQWKPRLYKHRDPRWFQYDKETGTRLMLRAPCGDGLEPLKPYHFVIHEPHLISGSQITAGLALPALYYWMLKSYDVTSWAAFIDRYGYPIRIGKYGKKFTEADKLTLKRAVANIGQDFGAIIPESAVLEIIESKHAGETSNVYRHMADWVDKQISKLVLGQTMTADDGASLAQSKTHEEVRQDIADSDVMQVIDTLNAALDAPCIDLNFGKQKEYPKIDLFKPDEKNIEQIIVAVEKLGPLGLKVKADEMRSSLGLSKGDEVIGGRPEFADAVPEGGDEPPPDGQLNTAMNAVIGAAAQNDDAVALDALIDEDGYTAVSDEIAEVIEKAADRAADFDSFRQELEKLVSSWPPSRIAECIAVATFKARVLGTAEFDKAE
jgi:phage gp29-like protein